MPEPSRAPIFPRQRRHAPGPVPTLADIRQHQSWVWVYCQTRDCRNRAALALTVPIIRWGGEASSDMLRERMRCTKCGERQTSISLPSPDPANFSGGSAIPD